MIFIDEPQWVSLESYENSIQMMTECLAKVPGVISVYQIGGLSSPGISDIDMVVVFEDEISCHHDPRRQQNDIGKYLFTHRLFATSISLFKQSQSYTFFHNFKLIYGKDLNAANHGEGSDVLQRQWAYEFLIKMFINMAVSREYGIYKVRNLLLTGKALLYDIDFLGVEAPELMFYVEEIIAWRERWFNKRPSKREISLNITGLWDALTEFIENNLKQIPLYFPERTTYLIGKNIELHYAERLDASSHGIKFPWVPKSYAREFISLQNRINKFNIGIPFQTNKLPPVIAKAFDYTEQAVKFNQHNLPHFMPFTSSLVLSP